MQLVNEFVVPRTIEETWAVLTDVERIAPAMPGAELTGVEDGKYNGKVKIKVGPVTAAYAGVASFRELDAVNHHMVLDATGKESSGRGRAAAVVTADLTAEGPETRVKVTTDLTISGPLAQFGRGAIAEVSTRLLNQFVAQLKETVLADNPAPESVLTTTVAETVPHEAVPEAAVPEATVPDAAAGSSAAGALTSEGAASESSPAPESAPMPATTVPATTVPATTVPATTVPATTVPAPTLPAITLPPTTRIVAPPRPPAAPAEVNLLKVAAWPILKRLIPLVIVVAAVVVLIVWLV